MSDEAEAEKKRLREVSTSVEWHKKLYLQRTMLPILINVSEKNIILSEERCIHTLCFLVQKRASRAWLICRLQFELPL